MTAEIIPLNITSNMVYPSLALAEWVTTSNMTTTATNVTVTMTTTGPQLTWNEGFNDWRGLRQVAHALLDGSRAARRGDDPAEVALAEWQRRTSR